jgi:hypothetical protein
VIIATCLAAALLPARLAAHIDPIATLLGLIEPRHGFRDAIRRELRGGAPTEQSLAPLGAEDLERFIATSLGTSQDVAKTRVVP